MPNQYNANDKVNVPAGTQFTGYGAVGSDVYAEPRSSVAPVQTYPYKIGSYSYGELRPNVGSGVVPGSGQIHTVASGVDMVTMEGVGIDTIHYPYRGDARDRTPMDASGIIHNRTPNAINVDPWKSSEENLT